jgi:hypothetical protein
MAKQTAFVKKAKEWFDQGDREVVVHGNGEVTIKRSYFYRHGNTAQKWAEQVLKTLPEAEEVDRGDHWAEWPNNSYFWVRVREKATVPAAV